jgi:hypothetical protein
MTTPFPFTSGQVLTAAQMNAITELVINDKTASHTLTAADAGDIVVMNSASATTITVNTSIFTTGQVVHIVNKGTASTVVTAGAGVTVSTSGSLTVPANGAGRLLALSASAFIFESSGSTSGLAVVKSETSFTASSSVTADSVFTSTYADYEIIFRHTSSTDSNLQVRFRTGGASNSTSNYNQNDFRAFTSAVSGNSTGITSILVNYGSGGGSNLAAVKMTVINPQVAAQTIILPYGKSASGGATAFYTTLFSGNFTAATQFDGIEFFPTSGTITGSYMIYGYSKS